MKLLGVSFLLVSLFGVWGCATTTIRGQIRLPADPTAAAPSPAGADRVTDAVIYVDEVLPRNVHARGTTPARPTVVQRRHRFVPHVLTIVAGTTVRFENRDRTFHKVFSVSPAKRFTSVPCPPEKSVEVTFDKPGVVRLFCEVDRRMDGFVLVVPNALYTKPDSTGAFEIKGLPRGQYKLTAWHPTEGQVSRRLDARRARDVDVRLRF